MSAKPREPPASAGGCGPMLHLEIVCGAIVSMMDETRVCRETRQPGFGRWLWGIMVLAVVARIAILIFAEHKPDRFDFDDSYRYVLVAENIAAGNGPIESDDVRSGTDPLYPGILAVGVLCGCDDVRSVMRFGRVVNAMLGVVSVALLALFARRVVGDCAALTAGAILAVDPILLFFNALVLTETCYIALLLCAFYAVIRLGGRRCLLWALAAGLLMGLATITRSSNLFLTIFMVPFVWHFSKHGDPSPTLGEGGTTTCMHREGRASRRLNRCLVTACFLLAAAVVLVPTVTRNYRLFGHFVPVRIGSGASLLEALGPWADGSPGMERIEYPDYPSDADEYVRDQLCRATAIDWTRHHWGDAFTLACAKLRRTWSISINAADYTSWVYVLMAWLTVAPVFILAVGGIWVLRRQPWLIGLLLIVAVYFSLVHVVFVGSVRYRVPALPFLFVLAGVAVDYLWRGWIGRNAAR